MRVKYIMPIALLAACMSLMERCTAMELIEAISKHREFSKNGYTAIKEMINKDNVNFKTEQHTTALHQAAFVGKLEIVKFLCESGAEVNAKNIWGTPLHFATAKKHAGVIAYLIEQGADPHIENTDGFTAHDLAKRKKRNQELLKAFS